MPTPKKTVTIEKAAAAAVDLALGKGRRHAVSKHGISENDAPLLRRIADCEMETFRAEIRSRLRGVADGLLTELEAKKGNIPAGSLPVGLAIILDKLSVMEGSPTHISASLSVNVGANGWTREQMASALAGTVTVQELKTGAPSEAEGTK